MFFWDSVSQWAILTESDKRMFARFLIRIGNCSSGGGQTNKFMTFGIESDVLGPSYRSINVYFQRSLHPFQEYPTFVALRR